MKEFPFGASALAVAEGKIWAGGDSKIRIIDAQVPHHPPTTDHIDF